MESNNIPARAMDLNDPKPVKFVIRGVPLNIKTKDIAEEVKNYGLKPIRIAYLKNRRSK